MSFDDDLRGAFTMLEERAPTTCDLPHIGQDAPRHRFRFALPLAAVAAVAAVAVAVPLTLQHRDPANPGGTGPAGTRPAAGSTPPTQPVVRPDRYMPIAPKAGQSVRLETDIALGPVAGYTATPADTTRLYQHVTVGIDALRDNQDQGVAGGGDLYAFYIGGQVPSEALQGQRVDINGHPGFIGQAYQPTPTGVRDGDTKTDSIAWQYTPNAWALLTMDASAFKATHTDERTELAKLARAVGIAPAVPIKVPFRMSYLPPGLYVDGGQSHTGKATAARGPPRTRRPSSR
jgi:hypothetical protein